MRRLLLISIMVVVGCNLYSGDKSFAEGKVTVAQIEAKAVDFENWPVLKRYDQNHLGNYYTTQYDNAWGVGSVDDNVPLQGHKAQLYEGGVRVPAVAVWPGVIKLGAVVKEPLHIVDMYPTLLKLAGAKLEQALPIDGRDAWPTIAEGRPSPHEEILHNVTAATGTISPW